MPEAYALAYAADERAEHLEIIERKAGRPVHVERWRSLSDGAALVAVVAEDQPGLLALICTALVRHSLEVRIAQIYSRRRSDESLEAVDFFWLHARSANGDLRGIEMHELQAVEKTLCELCEAPPAPAVGPSSLASSFDPVPATRAFFNTKSLRRGEYVLVVEAPDFPGLLLSVTSALHAQAVEIAESDVRTEGALARDSFVLKEPSGVGFTSERLAVIREAVVTALRAGRKLALGR